MASSSSKPKKSYHVFLSFRGPDVRNYFLGHLYTALNQAGINTYKDDEELRKGEQVSTELHKAIEESRIAIIVFSEHYASSTWCLKELAKIMECKEQRHLMVYPVFYKVEPCEVRTPRESYLQDMAKHEDKFGKDSEKVKRWKKALLDAGSLSGWHFTDGRICLHKASFCLWSKHNKTIYEEENRPRHYHLKEYEEAHLLSFFQIQIH